jgi:hypothetical protein
MLLAVLRSRSRLARDALLEVVHSSLVLGMTDRSSRPQHCCFHEGYASSSRDLGVDRSRSHVANDVQPCSDLEQLMVQAVDQGVKLY